jgi:hypothetical protein
MKVCRNTCIYTITIVGLIAGVLSAAPSKNFKVFLCFGQSNIAGGAGVSPGADETKTTDRVMALAFNNCSSPSWQKDAWVPAREPLHRGDGGAGNSTMGPVYVFGKVMADSLSGDTIGLIPCGQSGVNIEHFMKGGKCTAGYCVPYPGSDAYGWMLKKCQKAVERGEFAGIILHQGESNTSDKDAWLTKVKTIYNDLKKDIPLKNDVPLVAGQLLGNSALNTTIAKMSQTVTYGYYASSSGLSGGGTYPDLHFNQAGYRTMGQRMAVEMLKGLRAANPIVGVDPQHSQKQPLAISKLQENAITSLYTINGRKISASSLDGMIAGKTQRLYIMQKPGSAASLVIDQN